VSAPNGLTSPVPNFGVEGFQCRNGARIAPNFFDTETAPHYIGCVVNTCVQRTPLQDKFYIDSCKNPLSCEHPPTMNTCCDSIGVHYTQGLLYSPKYLKLTCPFY
ncbi:unnamed protein product, partial [Owenia fusiformis]